MKGKTLKKHSLHDKIAASVLLKLFISSNEWLVVNKKIKVSEKRNSWVTRPDRSGVLLTFLFDLINYV